VSKIDAGTKFEMAAAAI